MQFICIYCYKNHCEKPIILFLNTQWWDWDMLGVFQHIFTFYKPKITAVLSSVKHGLKAV